MPHDDDLLDPRADALTYGLDSLDDRALLGILLGQGGARRADALAAELLDRGGGLRGLGRCGPASLAELPGLGVARALKLAVALEIGRRFATRFERPTQPLDRPDRVAAFLAPTFASLLHEEMWVLSLDGGNRLRGLRRVAQGGLHAMSVSPGDILRAVVWDGATAFVLAHNHPSGRLESSREDVETTVRLAVVAEQLGVPLVDHLILAPDGGFLSMAELGVIEPASRRARPRSGR
ncbi:MAG: DNA repair protein RadC [Deltaproteobacteria bacterium]|nr:DNA repair protein RadC [Deltaproteobacteria bacterium]